MPVVIAYLLRQGLASLEQIARLYEHDLQPILEGQTRPY
jgi:hypothetical protein